MIADTYAGFSAAGRDFRTSGTIKLGPCVYQSERLGTGIDLHVIPEEGKPVEGGLTTGSLPVGSGTVEPMAD